MAFIGVFMSLGIIAALAWVMLCMTVVGCALLIASLVFLILYRRSQRSPEEPKNWERVLSIVCAVLGVVTLLPPLIIFLWGMFG